LQPSGRLGRLMAYARVPRQRPFRRLPHHATQLPLCFEVFEASMDAGRAPRADQQSYAKIIAPYFSSIVQHRSSKCKFGQERRQPRGNRLRRPGVTRRRRPRWRASAPEGKPAEGPRRVHRRSAMHRAALRRIIYEYGKNVAKVVFTTRIGFRVGEQEVKKHALTAILFNCDIDSDY
jgi:hypothetical protein